MSSSVLKQRNISLQKYCLASVFHNVLQAAMAYVRQLLIGSQLVEVHHI